MSFRPVALADRKNSRPHGVPFVRSNLVKGLSASYGGEAERGGEEVLVLRRSIGSKAAGGEAIAHPKYAEMANAR